jgi:hypothetical protein
MPLSKMIAISGSIEHRETSGIQRCHGRIRKFSARGALRWLGPCELASQHQHVLPRYSLGSAGRALNAAAAATSYSKDLPWLGPYQNTGLM